MSSAIKNIKRETEKILVLLVDDQAMVAEGVRRMLEADPSIAFHYVSDPKQALESAIKIGPTVILQDLVMPGVNGLDLLKEYRNSPFTRAIPVIVLSSKEEPAVKRIAFESGANDYMVKLPHRIELLARVRLHSEAYIHELQRQRTFQALEASQRELTEKNCELVLLNQKLEEATRFKSVFFANVSHEVRPPLIGILGMAKILSDTSLDTRQRESVNVIHASGETLLHIINDILDLSKFESGKLELESIPFALRDVVDQTMDLLAPIAFDKGLEMSAWIDPRIPSSLVGDITRVRQVLLNLVSNAIKFTSSGEIYLQVEPSVESDNMIHFCVTHGGADLGGEHRGEGYSISFCSLPSSRRNRGHRARTPGFARQADGCGGPQCPTRPSACHLGGRSCLGIHHPIRTSGSSRSRFAGLFDHRRRSLRDSDPAVQSKNCSSHSFQEHLRNGKPLSERHCAVASA